MGSNRMSPPRILSKNALATRSSRPSPAFAAITANRLRRPLFTATSAGARDFLTPNALANSACAPPSIHTNENGSFLYFFASSAMTAFSGNSSTPFASTTSTTHVPR